MAFRTPKGTGGGGGMVIGDPVTGGTPNLILYVDPSGNLGQDTAFQWNETTNSFSIASGTLGDGVRAFNLTATMPASPSATSQGVLWTVTSAGSASQTNEGFRVQYTAGYTGSSTTRALFGFNSVAGTGTNTGTSGQSSGTTTGQNVAIDGVALNGNINIGGRFVSTTAKNSAVNIGAMGLALNGGTSPIFIGGTFSLASVAVTSASAALIADNGATTASIFRALDGGIARWVIQDGAYINHVPVTLVDGTPGQAATMTLPTTAASTNYGINYQITTAGSSGQNQIGLNIDLLAGYTGGAAPIALRAINAVAGTGTTISTGNIGMIVGSSGTTVGTNWGISTFAQNGDINVGIGAASVTAKNGASNFGVLAWAANTGSTPKFTAGWFTLDSTRAIPTISTNSALSVTNAGVSANIITAMNNTTNVFQVLNNGYLSSTPATLTDGTAGFTITQTAPTTASTSIFGTSHTLTVNSGSYSGTALPVALNLNITGTYASSLRSLGIRVSNTLAGTGTGLTSVSGNAGAIITSVSTTTGTNVGTQSFASGGNINCGLEAHAIADKSGVTNIGVAGFASASTGSPITIGGYFGLQSSDPTFTGLSGAVVASNGSISAPIYLGLANTTQVFRVAADGQIQQTNANIVGIRLSNNETNSTLKAGRIGVMHYTNAEEPLAIFTASSDVSVSIVAIGGGSSLMNAATDLNFYTAANTTTAVGTVRATIDSAGNFNLGVTTAGATAAGVLCLSNSATAPTTSVDRVQLYGVDLSAGNATLGLFTETAVVTETVVSDRTLSVVINGTPYKICLKV